MEKTKIPLIFLLMLPFCETASAQNFRPPPFVRKTLMDISFGITGGVMAFQPVQQLYFNGSFSYCMEDQIAVRTDFYLFLPDANFEGQLDKNSSLFLGAEFHFPFHRFDISMIFQPGVAFCYLEGSTSSTKTQAEPVVNLGLETSYYILQNFHLFLNANYLHGDYFLEGTESYSLDELRITGGLGINIFVNHTAAYQRKGVKF